MIGQTISHYRVLEKLGGGGMEQRFKEVTRGIDQVEKHYKSAERLARQLATLPAGKKTRKYCRTQGRRSREIVRISIIIRSLGLTVSDGKRLADRVGKTAEMMRSPDRQINNLEKKSLLHGEYGIA